MRRRDKRRTCRCGGLAFPHRRGSKWCDHYAGRYSDADYEARYRAAPVPR